MPAQPSGLGGRTDTMTRAEGPAENAACGPIAMILERAKGPELPIAEGSHPVAGG
jgi:hypothetical protein